MSEIYCKVRCRVCKQKYEADLYDLEDWGKICSPECEQAETPTPRDGKDEG